MDSQRRDFIRQSGLVGGGLLLSEPFKVLDSISRTHAGMNRSLGQIKIIHTNDLHNCIEPLQTGRKSGYGGLKNLALSLKRSETPHLLLDAGDFLDDSASIEIHKRMIRSMNSLCFQASTIGNRELANGEEYLASLMPLMKFSLVNCNYRFEHAELKTHIQPFVILKTGSYKVGITGVGTDQLQNAEGIVVSDPYECANKVAAQLKNMGCDLVICLSHLGYKRASGPHNREFASVSANIDLIIGGHSELVMPEQMILRNKLKQEVIVSHGGPAGILVKQIVFGFDGEQQKHNITCKNIVPGAEAGVSAYSEIKRITA